MPMATESLRLTRRQWLSAAGAGCLLGVGGVALASRAEAGERGTVVTDGAVHRVAAAWDDGRGGHFIGILRVTPTQVTVQARIEVPTRAHALVLEPQGSVLAVARRPGEWLLRWHPPGHADATAPAGQRQWHWIDDGHRFNGHVLVGQDGGSLLTTETDLDTGAGRLVQRDRQTMAVTARWPTHGMDPHDMQVLPQGLLLVANGGIASRPETGRARLDLDQMDASLVALSPTDGRLHHSWTLPDQRQSLRHLAWHASGRVAVALQAQHDDAAQRDNAPVLAILDLQRSVLHEVQASAGMAGYAGDVAVVGDNWYVSCPRSDTLMRLSLDGTQCARFALQDACALAGSVDQSWGWASGRGNAMELGGKGLALAHLGLMPDNHAVAF